mmetsp:Transcript_147312/g.382979  ORF Transcript_147312/g.382979 Transcript_147312/m.382979 type:complete len:235 (+) Transcript_147312:293-997(+)
MKGFPIDFAERGSPRRSDVRRQHREASQGRWPRAKAFGACAQHTSQAQRFRQLGPNPQAVPPALGSLRLDGPWGWAKRTKPRLRNRRQGDQPQCRAISTSTTTSPATVLGHCCGPFHEQVPAACLAPEPLRRPALPTCHGSPLRHRPTAYPPALSTARRKLHCQGFVASWTRSAPQPCESGRIRLCPQRQRSQLRRAVDAHCRRSHGHRGAPVLPMQLLPPRPSLPWSLEAKRG